MEAGKEDEEVIEEAREVKECWYSIFSLLDTMAGFSPGDENLKRVLNLARERSREVERRLENLSVSFKKYNPHLREEADRKIKPLLAGLKEFRTEVRKEKDNFERFRETEEKIGKIRGELKDLEGEYGDVQSKVSLLCNKFFHKKEEYRVARERIEQRLEKELGNLERYFLDRAKGTVEGYRIFLSGSEVDLKELFDALVESPGVVEDLELVERKPRGMLRWLWRERGEPSEKLAVLGYLGEEVGTKAQKIKKKEGAQAEELRVEFADLDSAEKACREVENRRKEIEGYMEELQEKIGRLEREKVKDYNDYNQMLEVKSSLEGMLTSREEGLQGLTAFVEENMAGVEIETDPEKRSLKERIKGLEKELEGAKKELREKLPPLEEELEEVRAQNYDLEKELGKKVEELENLREEKKTLEGDYSEYKRSVGNELKEAHLGKSQAEEELERLKKEHRSYREKKEEKIESLEKKVERLEKEKDFLTRERDSYRDKAEDLEEKLNTLKSRLKDNMEDLLGGT